MRGYTDGFGHAMVLAGGVDAMVDPDLHVWETFATEVLATEAGGGFEVREQPNGGLSLVFGSPALVERIAALVWG